MQQVSAINTLIFIKLQKLFPVIFVFSLGLVLILTIGFVQGKGNMMHNAAHDTRHSAAFPCH